MSVDAEQRIAELEHRHGEQFTALWSVTDRLKERLSALESARGQAGEVEPEERVTFYSPSSSRPKLGEVCEHGHLKRQCELCSLAAERDRLAVKLSEAQDESAEHLRAVVQEIGHRDKARAERDAAVRENAELRRMLGENTR